MQIKQKWYYERFCVDYVTSYCILPHNYTQINNLLWESLQVLSFRILVVSMATRFSLFTSSKLGVFPAWKNAPHLARFYVWLLDRLSCLQCLRGKKENAVKRCTDTWRSEFLAAASPETHEWRFAVPKSASASEGSVSLLHLRSDELLCLMKIKPLGQSSCANCPDAKLISCRLYLRINGVRDLHSGVLTVTLSTSVIRLEEVSPLLWRPGR